MLSRNKLTPLTFILLAGFSWYLIEINEFGPGFSYWDGDFYYKRHDEGVCKLKIDGKFSIALEESFNKGIKSLDDAGCESYVLALNSSGGLLGVAMRIGSIVKEKKMTTIVLDKCKSACMFVFIAGQSRIANKESSLGLHQGADIDTKECIDPKVNSKDNRDFFSRMSSYTNDMLGAKVGGFFRSKDNVATCNEMLVLDNQELYKKGVITKLISDD